MADELSKTDIEELRALAPLVQAITNDLKDRPESRHDILVALMMVLGLQAGLEARLTRDDFVYRITAIVGWAYDQAIKRKTKDAH